MPCILERQQTLHKVNKWLMLTIPMQSNNEYSSYSQTDCVELATTDYNHSNIIYDSSDNSKVIGDMFESKENPNELLRLFAIMDLTRYLVQKGFESKVKKVFHFIFSCHARQRI
jgi:hypothetical protein